MKYVEINFDRVVELYREGEEDRAFRQNDSGELERVDGEQRRLNYFIDVGNYFEQIEEVE